MFKIFRKKNKSYADLKFDRKIKKYYQKYYSQFNNFKELLSYYKKIN